MTLSPRRPLRRLSGRARLARRAVRQPLDDGTVARAPTDGSPPVDGAKEPAVVFSGRGDVAGLQVLLDRKGASPGVIDGHFGSNVDKALAAYRDITGENLHSTDTEAIKKALAETGGDAFTTYTITPEDAAGPFVASVPADYGHKAKLDRLSFTSVSEMLAERFHMDEDYLKALNPEACSAGRHHDQGRQYRRRRADAGQPHHRRQGEEAGPRL